MLPGYLRSLSIRRRCSDLSETSAKPVAGAALTVPAIRSRVRGDGREVRARVERVFRGGAI